MPNTTSNATLGCPLSVPLSFLFFSDLHSTTFDLSSFFSASILVILLRLYISYCVLSFLSFPLVRCFTCVASLAYASHHWGQWPRPSQDNPNPCCILLYTNQSALHSTLLYTSSIIVSSFIQLRKLVDQFRADEMTWKSGIIPSICCYQLEVMQIPRAKYPENDQHQGNALKFLNCPSLLFPFPHILLSFY